MPDTPEENIPVEVTAVPDALSAAAPTLPDTSPPPWGWQDLGLFLVFAFLALLLSNFVALAGYAVLQPLLGWRTPMPALPENTLFLLTLQLLFYGLVFAFIYFVVVLRYRRPFWTAIRWHKPTGAQTLKLFLGGILLAVAVGLAPTLLPDRESFPLERMFNSEQAAYGVAAFAILIAPFMEELIFRGFLFSVFENKIGIHFAVGITALLFAALHVPEYWGAWNHVALILLVGMTFSLARGITGSLTPSVILHIAYNASLMTGLFFSTQHFRTLS
jgi:membrane protease YdiL (CAAX protease family)